MRWLVSTNSSHMIPKVSLGRDDVIPMDRVTTNWATSAWPDGNQQQGRATLLLGGAVRNSWRKVIDLSLKESQAPQYKGWDV